MNNLRHRTGGKFYRQNSAEIKENGSFRAFYQTNNNGLLKWQQNIPSIR